MILFDFDGTLANTSAPAELALQEVARRRGVAVPDNWRDLPAKQLMKALRVSWWNLFYYVAIGREVVAQHKDLTHPYPNLLGLLQYLDKKGWQMGILSSNSQTFIRAFVEQHFPGVRFDFIQGSISLFGKTKHLRRWVQANQTCFYIGDEVRDVEAARAAGAVSVAVTWGKDSRHHLISAHPHYLVETVDDLQHIIEAQVPRYPNLSSR